MTATERLELPDGQWADIRRSPTHDQFRAVIGAMEAAMLGRGSTVDWASVTGRQMTASWFVRSEDGVSLDLDDEGWGEAPADVVDAICGKAQEAWEAWQKARRPKAKSARSSGSTSADAK